MNSHCVLVNSFHTFNVINSLDTAKVGVGTVKLQDCFYAFCIESSSIGKSDTLAELECEDSVCVIPSPFLSQYRNNFSILIADQSFINQSAGNIIFLVHGQCGKIVQLFRCGNRQHLCFAFISRLRRLAAFLCLIGGTALTAANHRQKHTYAQCGGDKFLVNLFHVILFLSVLVIYLLDNPVP